MINMEQNVPPHINVGAKYPGPGEPWSSWLCGSKLELNLMGKEKG